MIVSWFSAGCSSAVATKIAIQKYGTIKIIYQHIDDQHPDTMRFLKDCEKWFGQEIEIMQGKYKSVDEAARASGFLVSAFGAGCTKLLKRRVRMDWEKDNPGSHTYVWGMDANESKRQMQIEKAMHTHTHYFPLIENGLDKMAIHGMIETAGIKRPAMYNLGYPNNNCVGCVKGGMGYWQKIRQDFPDVYKKRSELERVIGRSCLKEYFLDELPLDKGRELKAIVPDCGIFCELPETKAGALHYNLQQPHGGQSVSQPAPNCLTATSPC